MTQTGPIASVLAAEKEGKQMILRALEEAKRIIQEAANESETLQNDAMSQVKEQAMKYLKTAKKEAIELYKQELLRESSKNDSVLARAQKAKTNAVETFFQLLRS